MGSTSSHAAHAPASPPTRAIADRLGPPVFRCALGASWAYACALVPLGRLLGDDAARSLAALALFALGAMIFSRAGGTRLVSRWISASKMLDVGIAGLALLAMVLAADLVLTMRDNWLGFRSARVIASDVRGRDETVWHGELYPRTYRPAGESFLLYKPNVRVTADTYGERYVSSMRESRTMREAVLERRHLSYAIGPEGLRELEPLASSRIFALGDSFAFGFATDEGKTWTDLLGAALGQPVYNMGVSATGPKPQLDLLKFMFKQHAGTLRVEHLLWMIFEGNDLENSYADDTAPEQPAAGLSMLLAGTLVEPILGVPANIRRHSIAARLARGDLRFSGAASRPGMYEIDGVSLPIPLFRSERFGYRLFVPADMEAATKPREYVLNHPNRPLLDRTFQQMRDLSRSHAFRVTVVIAPSDARLYGAAFDGFPALSQEPHFVNYVASLGREMDFGVIDLLPLLRPYAESEMLYYRDDHHWNERGNAIVADLLAATVAKR